MNIRPAATFDWLLVEWRGPKQRIALICSYCRTRFGEDEMPLMLWNKDSWAARFCEVCQRKYFGLETFPNDEDAQA